MSESPEIQIQDNSARALQTASDTEISATTLAAEVEATVKAKYSVALRNPRDIDVARSRILKACRRPAFARSARYEKPQGGQKITGPSIRFAEEALRSMGNVDVTVRTIFEDEDRRKIRVDCTDLETNTGYSGEAIIAKTVERKKLREGQQALGYRTNSYGDTVYLIQATEDEMVTKTNAIVSKVMRTQGLRLVPGDIVEEAMDLCIKTAKDADAQDPEGARRRILDAFDALSIGPAELKKHLGIDPTQLTPKELEELRALHEAIKTGETTWRAVIAEKEGDEKPKSQGAKDAAKAAAAAAKKKADPNENPAHAADADAGQQEMT